MLEQLTRFFTAAYRMRRSERKLVRSGSLLELEELSREVHHPMLKNRINTALNEGIQKKVKVHHHN